MSEQYIVKEKGSAYYEIKKSKFYSYCISIENKEKWLLFLQELWKEYPKARHICWGLRTYEDTPRIQDSFSDDGEPSGSAGRPILDHIAGNNLIQTGVCVVRYFGGIKLGVGGLVSAYGEAAKQAIQKAQLKVYIKRKKYTLICQYSAHSSLLHDLEKLEGNIANEEYTDKILLVVEIPLIKEKEFQKLLNNKYYGIAYIIKT